MACLRYAPPHRAAMQALAIDIFDIAYFSLFAAISAAISLRH
jgi:hypothetical protein